MLEKVSHIILLNDFYGALLTPKQQEILSLYYESDLSLSEIADNKKVSKQAIYDIIKRAENTLEQYENKLGLVNKFITTRRKLAEIRSLLDSEIPDQDSINKAIRILRQVTDLV